MEELVLKKKNHHRTSKKKVAEVEKVPEPPKEKTLEEVYLQWHSEQYDAMKDTLDSAFGDNYEITKYDISLGDFLRIGKETTAENQAIVNRLLDLSEFDGVIGQMRTRPAYTIIIHFPDLVVSNGRREHPIKDIWVKIELSAAFCRSNKASGMYFSGTRSTMSYAEISSEYSFSHLSGGWRPDNFRDFCLGHTNFAFLCTDLYNTWNKDRFLSFCFQLEAYLSWESLEGGPYRTIDDIRERNLRRTEDSDISRTDLNRIYGRILALREKLPVQFVKTPLYWGLRVKEGDDFEVVVSQCCDAQHLMVYDPVTKRKTPSNVSNKDEMIKELMRGYARRNIVSFKGKNIKLVVTDPVGETTNNDVPMRASDRIVQHMRQMLNQALLNETTSEYRK